MPRPSSEMRAGDPPDTSAVLVARLVVLAALVSSPWFFGAIAPAVQIWLFGALLVALIVCGLEWSGSDMSLAMPAGVLPILAALALGIFQLVPLDSAILKILSPTGERLWREMLVESPASEAEVKAETETTDSKAAAELALQRNGTTERSAEASVANALGIDALRERAPLSLYPAVTRRGLLQLLLGAAAFVVGATLFRTRRGLRWLVVLVALNGAALAFFGIIQQLTWNGKMFWQVPLSSGGVPFASYVNKNHAAGYLSVCLACALAWMMWSSRVLRQRLADDAHPWQGSRGWRAVVAWGERRGLVIVGSLDGSLLFSIAAVVCIMAGVACSLSRGAWISVAGATLLVAIAAGLARPGRVRWWTLAAAVAIPCLLATALVIWLGAGNPVAHQAGRLVDESSHLSNGRLEHWRDGAAAAREFWRCGSGLGTYRFIYRLYEQRPSRVTFYHAENQYLEAFVELGLPGLCLLLTAIALGACACFHLLRQRAGSTAYCAGWMGAFALGTQVLHSGVDFALCLPANLCLLAVLMGTVAGWAVRSLAEASAEDAFAGLPVWQRLAASIVPPHWCGLLIGGLAFGVALAGVSLRGWAAAEDSLRRAPLATSAKDVTATDMAERLQRLDAGLAAAPDDAELHLQAARLWAFRYRLVTLNQRLAERGAAADREALWPGTEPAVLRAQIYDLGANHRTVERDVLRSAPAVRDNLASATRHLLRARRACPLLPEAHLYLGETCTLAAATDQDAVHLRRARVLAPGDDDLWTFAGRLELDAGRPEDACASWRHALELAPQRLPAILAWARPRLPLATHLNQLLPSAPQVALEGAQWLAANSRDRPALQAACDKLQAVLDRGDYPEAERGYYHASILSLQGELPRAIVELERAVELCPDRTSWRYQLALLLRQSGKIPQAREQMKQCLRAEPANSRYEELLRELIRAEIIRGKDRTRGA